VSTLAPIDLSTDINGVCPHCDGQGVRIVEDAAGRRSAVPCVCRAQRRASRVLQQARIPRRYERCTFDSYDLAVTPSLKIAFRNARKFVETYPLETQGRGLLFTGGIGTGKTHLAVSLLKGLIEERGASGLFYDYRELLKQVQHSYNPRVAATELEILAPVFDAEVLVLDEIGASKPTDWVWDTVAHILNTRYNDRRTTIITTNFANMPPLGMVAGEGAAGQARAAMRDETLGDRIGERMRSRLQEMCVVVEMQGEDFRQKVKHTPVP
jgi:DNA replication protein DnaC